MAKSLFVKAEELQELLGISRSESYRIIKKLNDDLKEKGFIVLSGRVSRKYLEEMIYGYPTDMWQIANRAVFMTPALLPNMAIC